MLEICLANCASTCGCADGNASTAAVMFTKPCYPQQQQLQPLERGECEQLELVSLLDSGVGVSASINKC